MKINVKTFILILYRKIARFLGILGLRRISLLRDVNRYLDANIKPDFVEIDGHKIFLDKFDSLHLYRRGHYEEYETEIIKKIIKKGDIVLDVGANIGYFTLIFAKLVGKNGKVFAFEPDPKNFDLLSKNIKINGYKNVTLVRKALSDKTAKTNLFLSKTNSVDHRTVDPKENRDSIEIEKITADDYFSDFKEQINFIKMDIQGSEVEALSGLSSLLQKMNDIIIMIEFAPMLLRRVSYGPVELLNYLKEYDFNLFEMDDIESKIIPTSSQALIKKYPPDRKEYTNLLCTKDDQFLKFKNNLSNHQ